MRITIPVLTVLVLLAEAAWPVPPPVARIDIDDLLDQPTVSPSELIDALPGFHSGGDGPPISVRGVPGLAEGNKPLYIVDGVKFAGEGSPLNGLSPEMIESVQVVKGAAAATLYGTDAINGVINIVTKKGFSADQAGGSFQLGWLNESLGNYGFSLQSRESCDATNGASNPAWSYFGGFNYGIPEFSDHGRKAWFGSTNDGYRLDYGVDLSPRLGFDGSNRLQRHDFDWTWEGDRILLLNDLTFTRFDALIERMRNDPAIAREAVDGLMFAVGLGALAGSFWHVSDQAYEAGAFDPEDYYRDAIEYSREAAGLPPLPPDETPPAAGTPGTGPEPPRPGPAEEPGVTTATPAGMPEPPSPFDNYPYPPDYAFDFSLCTAEQRATIERLIRERDQARADMSYFGDFLRHARQSRERNERDLEKVEEARQTRESKNRELEAAWNACVSPDSAVADRSAPSTGSVDETEAATADGAADRDMSLDARVNWDMEIHVYRNKRNPDGSLGTEPVPDIGVGVYGDRDRFSLDARLRYGPLVDEPALDSGLGTNRVYTDPNGVARIPYGFKAGFGRPDLGFGPGNGGLQTDGGPSLDMPRQDPGLDVGMKFGYQTPSGRNWNMSIDWGDADDNPTLGLRFRYDKIDSVVQRFPGLGGQGMTYDRLPDETKESIPEDFRLRAGQGFSINENFYLPFDYAEYRDLDLSGLDDVVGQGGWTNNFCGDTAFPGEGTGYVTAEETPVKSPADRWALPHVRLPQADSVVYQFSDPVVVGIVDTGIDWHHPDLPWDALWKNEDEVPGNGVDDDENGYVDDVIGWDFTNDNNSPYDHDGHGTFVTGLIAAAQGNGAGIDGINPNARIMVLKALNNFGRTRASTVAQAIVYGVDNGARILNLSISGPGFPEVVQDAVDYANSKGVLVVMAAGNRGEDLRNAKPALLRNVLLVGATDPEDRRAVFSNVGDDVTIAAPGVDVVSLRAARSDFLYASRETAYMPGDAFLGEGDRYYRATGTSFAAPIVSGVASLVLSMQPQLTAAEVRRILEQSARDIGTPGRDRYTGYGLVDASAALNTDPAFYVDAAIRGVRRVEENGATYIAVDGRAAANAFAGARLEIGQGEDPLDWAPADEVLSAVDEGELGRIPATALGGATSWTLRLVVAHADGRQRESRYRLDLR